MFESSVNSYDSQTENPNMIYVGQFESSVNSYNSTNEELDLAHIKLVKLRKLSKRIS